jgi:Rrf2 family protein
MSSNSHLTTAIHALCWLELARRQGHLALTSERVAASLASEPALVRRSLAPLRRAGVLTTRRGPGAGWSLARPGMEITLDEVYFALDQSGVFALHPHEPNNECPVGFGIRPVLAHVYADVDTALRQALASRTIADVLDEILADHPLPV